MDDNSSVSSRSTLEVFHFALCAAGFFIGAGGIVIASIPVALLGGFFMLWSLLFFLVNG